MFLIKFIQPSGRSRRPGDQRFLFDTLTGCFICFFKIETTNTFPPSIDNSGNGMVGVHTAGVTGHFRECRHPVRPHLLGHQEIGVDNIGLTFFIDQDTKRMGSTIGIPNPVVGIERMATVFMYLAIKSTIVFTVFAQIHRTFITTV